MVRWPCASISLLGVSVNDEASQARGWSCPHDESERNRRSYSHASPQRPDIRPRIACAVRAPTRAPPTTERAHRHEDGQACRRRHETRPTVLRPRAPAGKRRDNPASRSRLPAPNRGRRSPDKLPRAHPEHGNCRRHPIPPGALDGGCWSGFFCGRPSAPRPIGRSRRDASAAPGRSDSAVRAICVAGARSPRLQKPRALKRRTVPSAIEM
jgi:hypothetical protein